MYMGTVGMMCVVPVFWLPFFYTLPLDCTVTMHFSCLAIAIYCMV